MWGLAEIGIGIGLLIIVSLLGKKFVFKSLDDAKDIRKKFKESTVDDEPKKTE